MRNFLALSATLAVACGGPSNDGSSIVGPSRLELDAAKEITAGTTNNAPDLEIRTTPSAVEGVIGGQLPLDVRINLCRSSDADAGDSLRYDVTWGDGVESGVDDPGAGTDPEDGIATGCGGPDCCRHRHRFESEGTFIVRASVSDKHLEDQSADVSALAISTATLTVRAGALVAAPESSGCAGPLTVRFDDDLGDNVGGFGDITSVQWWFDPATGDYTVKTTTDPAQPFAGTVRLNLRMWNADSSGGCGTQLVTDELNDFAGLAATTSLTLSGNDARLMSWATGDRVAPESVTFGAPCTFGSGGTDLAAGSDSLDAQGVTVTSCK